MLQRAASSPFFHPESIVPSHQMISDEQTASQPQLTTPLLGRALLPLLQHTCLNTLPSWAKQSCRKHLDIYFILPFYIFMKSTRSSCSYTSLPSLYYLHQCTSVWYWTLVPSSILYNNLLGSLIYSLLLFWVTLHNTEVTILGKSKGLLKCFPSTFKSVTNSFISILQT